MSWSCPCLFRSCTPKKVWDTTKGMIGELVPPVRPSNASVVALLPSISHPTQRDGFLPVLPGTGQKPRHQKVLSRLLSHFGEHLEHVVRLEFLYHKDSLSQWSGLTSHGRTTGTREQKQDVVQQVWPAGCVGRIVWLSLLGLPGHAMWGEDFTMHSSRGLSLG